MRKKVIVRADGGKELGLGHWSRCLFLISYFREVTPNLHITLFTRNAADFKEEFPTIDTHVIQLHDEEEFLKAIGKKDVVLLDGYFFTPEYFKKLRQKDPFIIYIDDLLQKGIRADIILNHAPGINPSHYISTAPYAAFFLGGRFSMVSELFINSNLERDQRLENVLLCMGGADPLNYTAALLEKHHEYLKRFKEVYIIIGQQYQFKEKLAENWSGISEFQILKGLTKQQVAELMQKCGTAILPASTMAIEYAHVGGLLGIIQTADNQQKLYNGLLTDGVAKSLNTSLFQENEGDLYDQLTTKQQQFFDGNSKKRISKLFKEIELQLNVKLRQAEEKDLSLTFSWASDKEIRKYSFSKEEINWNEHQSWFNKKLEDKNCLYLIAEKKDVPLGSIRFDIKNEDAIISYLVDSSFHGKGLGRIILAEGIKYLLSTQKNLDFITGYVMPENKASVQIFERLGFKREAKEGKLKYFKKVDHE